jgi:hypothetical protein
VALAGANRCEEQSSWQRTLGFAKFGGSVSTEPIINVSTYRFVQLQELPQLRARLSSVCAQLELKGTILLASEGINVFAAGARSKID